MTADDFARYYHDQRGYKFPQYRTATDEERIAAVQTAVAANTRETRLEQPKKAGWLTDADKLPAFLQKLMSRKAFVWLNEWAGETFPRETEMSRESREDGLKRSRPIPAGLVAALVTVLLSMTMVISSTVSVSQATRDVSGLKENLSELKEVHGDLQDQLDLKNDMLAIEEKASGELGMVHEKYLNGEYLTEEVEDRLEVFDEDRDGEKSGLAWLLSAFGIGD
jgi:cell division protein FtsB